MTSKADASPDHRFELDEALAIRTVGDGRLEATVVEGWDVGGVPHGGYLLAMAATAARTVSAHADPLSVSATYLSAPRFGPADLEVRVLRAGTQQTTFDLALRQHQPDGSTRLRVQTQVTLGTLEESSEILANDASLPEGPGPQDWAAMSSTSPDFAELVPALHRRIEMRLDPELAMFSGRSDGAPEVDGWMRTADGRPVDSLALLVYSDLFPPSIYQKIGFWTAAVPTVQLTTHLFGTPGSEWIRGRSWTRVRSGQMVDQDMDLWDEQGRLVATSRQLALIRPVEPPAPPA